MKKILFVVLVICLLFVLFSCAYDRKVYTSESVDSSVCGFISVSMTRIGGQFLYIYYEPRTDVMYQFSPSTGIYPLYDSDGSLLTYSRYCELASEVVYD